jgi:hypothetical protein
MGRVLSLRGSFDMNIGRASFYGASTEHQIFDYESGDRTKGWKVRFARIWMQECYTGSGGGDSRALIQWALSTDTLGSVTITDGATAAEWENRLGAQDNRTIGWLTTDYQNRDNASQDFIVPAAGWGSHDLLLDMDRIVTNELWIQGYGITEGNTLDLKANYYIELEEVKISAAESILQQIKGIGQDVEN